MHLSKVMWAFLLTICLMGFVGDRSLVTAGGDPPDPPHATHLTHARGPHLGGVSPPAIPAELVGEGGCDICHTDTPAYNYVDWEVCKVCHNPGGEYHKDTYPKLWAVNNWQNKGSSDVATTSMIYDGGALRTGKEKWCATCHDESIDGHIADGQGTVLEEGEVIENFQGYDDTYDLQHGTDSWDGTSDAYDPTLYFPYEDEDSEAFYKTWDDAALGQCCVYFDYYGMKDLYVGASISWNQSTNGYGVIKKNFDPAIDLSRLDSFGFWMKVSTKSYIPEIRVKLYKGEDVSKCVFDVSGANGFVSNEWRLVVLPRKSFDNNGDDHWGSVDKIQFRIQEQNSSDTTRSVNIWFDEIGCNFSGPNVVGNDPNPGCYKTGHRFCTFCHDPSSEHIDGNRMNIFRNIKIDANPTNFRFYDPVTHPTKQMTLPFNCNTASCDYDQKDPYYGYYLQNQTAFALCYSGGCHREMENVMMYGTYEELYDAKATNFTDMDYWFGGSAANANLHLYHMKFSPEPWRMTCVSCHDPHGQSNPAMLRKECGNLFYFDPSGCEIPDRVSNSDDDETPDWYDPDHNEGGAQTTYDIYGSGPYYEPLCGDVCHNDNNYNSNCPNSSEPPIKSFTSGNNGYKRTYQYIPHGVGEPNCFSTGCHAVNQMHAAHFVSDPGPGFPLNETGCYYCHADGRLQCAAAPLFKNVEDPEGPPQYLSETAVCDPCHSAGCP